MMYPGTPDPAATAAAAGPTPDDMESAGAAAPSAAELAALRARLREVEAALGLPLHPGQPVPPDLPALRRRVAALERHLGVVPGLLPVPGCDEVAARPRTTIIADEPAGRPPAWREWGRAALLVAALLALLAWLLHPLPGGPGVFRAAAPTTQPAAGAPATAQVVVAVPASMLAEEQPARADYRAQHEDLSPAPPGAPPAPTTEPGDGGLPRAPRLVP